MPITTAYVCPDGNVLRSPWTSCSVVFGKALPELRDRLAGDVEADEIKTAFDEGDVVFSHCRNRRRDQSSVRA
jgi:hypothetical protein